MVPSGLLYIFLQLSDRVLGQRETKQQWSLLDSLYLKHSTYIRGEGSTFNKAILAQGCIIFFVVKG